MYLHILISERSKLLNGGFGKPNQPKLNCTGFEEKKTTKACTYGWFGLTGQVNFCRESRNEQLLIILHLLNALLFAILF